MRLFNIIQCTNLGGMEQASVRLMTECASRGIEVVYFSLNELGPIARRIVSEGMSVQGFRYSRGAWLALVRTLVIRGRHINPHVIVVTGHSLPAFLAVALLRKRKAILAMHFHHAGVMSDWKWKSIYWLACRVFDVVTFPSDFVRLEAESLHPPLCGKSLTLRNPLPPVPQSSSGDIVRARLRLQLPIDAKVVGNAGWFIPRKRFDVFLATAAAILKIDSNFHFVIAGGGECEEDLRSQVASLNISPKVSFVGWLEDMELFYRSLDVLLFNTDSDALPTTPLEAMNFGIPVVASSLFGGLHEILNDKNGWIIDRHDVAALASNVIEAVSSAGLMKGREAMLDVQAQCAPNAVLTRFLPLIEA